MFDGFDINSMIQILMLFVISAQLLMVQRTFVADHERRKKQSTVEYLNNIRTKYRIVTNKLVEKFGSNAINLSEIDEGTKNEIKELLSILEHMSVGINTEVYDYDIIKRMSGSYLVSRYKQLYPYIDESQNRNPVFYMEFVTLCKRIESDKRKVHITTSGNIKYSSSD